MSEKPTKVKRSAAIPTEIDENDFIEIYMKLPEETRGEIGHKFGVNNDPRALSIAGMFIKCDYKGEDCLKVDTRRQLHVRRHKTLYRKNCGLKRILPLLETATHSTPLTTAIKIQTRRGMQLSLERKMVISDSVNFRINLEDIHLCRVVIGVILGSVFLHDGLLVTESRDESCGTRARLLSSNGRFRTGFGSRDS